MQIVVSKQDNVVGSLNFNCPVVHVGSDPDAHVYLPDGRIAPHQADLKACETGWIVEPLSLDHALILNAAVADAPTPIKNGDEIRLGDFALKIYFDDDSDPSARTVVAQEVARMRRHALPPGALVHKEAQITLHPPAKAAVAEVALQLPQCPDPAALLNLCAGTLREVFDARMVWIGVRRKNYGKLVMVEGVRKDGKTPGDPPDLDTFLFRCLEHHQFIAVPRMARADAESALAVPLLGATGSMGLIYLDSPPGSKPYEGLHLDQLSMYAALIARQYENLLSGQAHHQQAVADGELSFIRQVQARLDPGAVPEWEPLQIAVYCKPGSERCGNVYDVMRLPNGLAAFLLADAEGTRTRAALAMAEVRAAFRMAAMHADPPHVLLKALNWLVRADREPCLLHCAALVMNPNSGACEYAIAGDVGAVVLEPSGEPRALNDPRIKPLGSANEYPAAARTERVAPGETAVFYSRGCKSVTDAGGNQLGAGPLVSAFCDAADQPAAAALEEVLTDLSAFFKEGRPLDDITMLWVHRR